jgi:hypothetical protein
METTIASLFEQAALKLRSDFEYIRASNPHAGEKGQEVEAILRDFLNSHLPKRWRADAGVVIDFEDQLSRQSDVIVYDSISAPLYRAGDRMNILPAHNVAAVIEVKSTLNKRELKDAYENRFG